MDERVGKRFSFLVNLVYLAVFVAFFYLFVKYALPLVAPFAVALVLAAILQRPSNYLNRKTKIPKGIAGAVLVLLIVGSVAGLIAVAGVQITSRISDFVAFLTSKIDSIPALITDVQNWLLEIVAKLPSAIAGSLTDSIRNFSADALFSGFSSESVTGSISAGSIFSALKTPLSGAWSTVKQVPSFVVGVLITIISACFLTKDYPIIRDFILMQLPERARQKTMRAKKLVFYSIGKIVKSYLLIIIITTCELSLGLGILKLFGIYTSGYIIAISVLIAIIDIVPVLGTGTVLIPWAVISLITGDAAMGVGLIIMYVFITVLRQIIEPKLVAGQFDLPAIVTIMSMYIGTKIFGAIGLFLLPLTVIVLKLLADEGLIGFIKTKKSQQREDAKKAGMTDAELDAQFENEMNRKTAAAVGTPGQRLQAFVTQSVLARKKSEKGGADKKDKDGEKKDAQ